jgi:hypothetical protein
MVLPRKLLVDFKLKGTQWRIFPNVKSAFTNLIFKKICAILVPYAAVFLPLLDMFFLFFHVPEKDYFRMSFVLIGTHISFSQKINCKIFIGVFEENIEGHFLCMHCTVYCRRR